MNLYYNIANHIVSIACDKMAIMENMEGFSVFKIDNAGDKQAIEMTLIERKPEEAAGKLYYRLETEVADCLFYKNSAGIALEIWQHKERVLTMQHDEVNNKSAIVGDMNPILLRYALWSAFNLSVLKMKTVAIHTSTIVYKGKAMLALGESGTGKSTHTRLICEHHKEAQLLNDDSPIVRIENGKAMVYGSPWSGKKACYHQQKAELAGIVRIEQAPQNEIIQLGVSEALSALLPSCPPELYLDTDYQGFIFNIVSDVIGNTPIYLLKCLPNKEAAQLSINTIFKNL